MSSPIYFIRVGGKMEADAFVDTLEESGLTTDDNIVVVDEQVDPMDREEVLFFLEEMARTMDVAEEMNIDWEQFYADEDVV